MGGAGTLALTADMKQMRPDFVKGASFPGYGVSLAVGVGVPIPILNAGILKRCCVRDRDILAPVIDDLCPSFASVLARSGTGLLSGLLRDQQPWVEQALSRAGWATCGHGLQGPWALLRIHGGAEVS